MGKDCVLKYREKTKRQPHMTVIASFNPNPLLPLSFLVHGQAPFAEVHSWYFTTAMTVQLRRLLM